MLKEKFVEMVAEQIVNVLPAEYEDAKVSIQEVMKNNDQKLTGLTIRKEGVNMAPNIYLDSFYDQYEEGRDFDEILEEIAKLRVENDVVEDFDVNSVTSWDYVKENVQPRLVGTGNGYNKSFLEDKPYTSFEDMAIVYYIALGGNENGLMTAAVTTQMLDGYGVTLEELNDAAIQNLSKKGFEFKSMREVMMEMFPGACDGLIPEEETPSLYVLTNSEKCYGASTLLDSNATKQISEQLGGDYVILPSSVHEVLILPMSSVSDKETLESMVREVNETQVAPNERLSDHIYRYDSESGKVHQVTGSLYKTVLTA